jgi:hypothetical protein
MADDIGEMITACRGRLINSVGADRITVPKKFKPSVSMSLIALEM